MRGELTDRQAEVLEYIRAFFLEHHRFPKLREIMAHFAFKSPNGVVVHLKAMVNKGWLEREERENHGYYKLAGVTVELRESHETGAEGLHRPLEARPDGDVPGGAGEQRVRRRAVPPGEVDSSQGGAAVGTTVG